MNRTVPLILAVALFMENMDSTVIATSLPAIATDIGTSPIALKLALTAYLVSLAIFIPVSAWMADRFGAKRIFRGAILVFILGSVLCSVSGSLAQFVGARFLQGIGGAMMTPVARLVLVRSTEKSQLVNAMAWLTIPGLIGPLAGPPVGGFITTYFSWHWIFLINVPIGIAGFVLSGMVLPELPPEGAKKLDLPGFFLSGIAASGIVFGLSVISLPALPPIVGIVTVLAGLASAVAYVLHAKRTDYPLLELRLLRGKVFRAAIVGGNVYRIGAGAVPFLLPLMLQLGFGLTPFASGMITFASAGGALIMKLFAPRLLRRFGFRAVLTAAAAGSALLMGINGFFTPATPHLLIIAVLFFAGFLRSLFFTSSNALVFSDIEPQQTGQATAMAAVAQQTSVAIGVAVGGGALEIFGRLLGQSLTLPVFTLSFMTVAVITALAVAWFALLPADAGAGISGHVPKPAPERPPLG